MTPRERSSTPVRLRGVSKRYGSLTAVSELDLEVGSAEVFALLGPNGAGKTTTVEMCEGFLAPDGGSIEILGLDPVADNAQVVVLLNQGLDELELRGVGILVLVH